MTRWLFFLIVFFFFSSVFAQRYPLISNGSFESCSPSGSSSQCGSLGGSGKPYCDTITAWTDNESVPGTLIRYFDNNMGNYATDGNIFVCGSTSAFLSPFNLLSHSDIFTGGRLFFDLNGIGNINFWNNESRLRFSFDPRDKNKSTIVVMLDLNNASLLKTYDLNFPTIDGNLLISTFRNVGTFTLVNFVLDNFRYQRFPLIINDTNSPHIQHYVEGKTIAIDVNYPAGTTCIVKNETDNIILSAAYQGNNTYRTSSFALSLNSNQNSRSVRFSADCNNAYNNDKYGEYDVRINKDALMNNGSFEDTNLTSYGATPFGSPVGYTDNSIPGWENISDASGKTYFIRERLPDYNISEDGKMIAGVFDSSFSDHTRLKSLQTISGGNIFFDILSTQCEATPPSSCHFKIKFDPADGSADSELYSVSTAISPIKDVNIAIPNTDGNIYIVARAYRVGLDNFRYRPKPQLVLDALPFNKHIGSGENFTIDVNYPAGFNCTVLDKNTLTTYPATYVGNHVYRTNNIQFTVPSNQDSTIKDFNVTCGTQSNNDYRWKLKINKHDLLSSNGGFDNNSAVIVTSSTTTAVKDWEVNITGTGEFDIIKNTSTANKSTDGQYYGRIKPGSSGTNVELKSKSVLFGGALYFDSNYFNAGASPANNLKAIYYYENGGSETIFDSSSNIVGIDRNIIIPNQYGKLSLSLGGSNDNLSEFIFDNIRYQGGNSECKQITLKGSSNEKIDVVFIGSGFPNSTKLRQAAELLINQNGDENGFFSFEPFSNYQSKFNFWYVDNNKTYNMVQNIVTGNWRFDIGPIEDASKICSQGNEYVLLSYYPRFRAYGFVAKDAFGSPTGDGLHWAFMTTGCELNGDCNYPVDVKYTNPYDIACQGDGNLFVSCNQPADDYDDLQRLFTHEFGHSFGGLLDEYQTNNSNAPFSINPDRAPNCDISNVCSKFSQFSDLNCQSVCSYPNWFRAYPTSLMENHFSPRQEFRNVNKTELENDISDYNTAATTTFGSSEYLTYVLSIYVVNGAFGLRDIQLVYGKAPEKEIFFDANYSVKMRTDSSGIVYDFNFYPMNSLSFESSSEWFDSNGEQSFIPDMTDENISDYNFVIRMPYYPTVSEIDIEDINGLNKITVDVSPYQYNLSEIIGGGGGADSNILQDRKINYTMGQQPFVAQISSQNYKASLGWSVYYD